MLAPDPSLVLDQGLSFSCLGILGPCRGRSEPHARGSGLHPKDPACTRGGPGPPLGVPAAYPEVRRSPMGGPDLLLTSRSIPSFLETWRSGAAVGPK
jgi:hypothetical protein